MTDPDAARFERAATMFREQVSLVGDDQWSAATPCSEWDVRALVNHVVVEMLWAPPLLAGRTIAEVGDSFDGDQLGTDPAASCDRATHGAIEAFTVDGALAGQVHLSYGDESAVGYCTQMTLDALIHGWDLATAVGADATMPEELTQWAVAAVEPMQDMLSASGMFGSPLAIDADAGTQARLLAMLGRPG